MLQVGMKLYKTHAYRGDELKEYIVEKIARKYFYLEGDKEGYEILKGDLGEKFMVQTKGRDSSSVTFYLDPKTKEKEDIRKGKEKRFDRMIRQWDSKFKVHRLSNEDLDKILEIMENSIPTK